MRLCGRMKSWAECVTLVVDRRPPVTHRGTLARCGVKDRPGWPAGVEGPGRDRRVDQPAAQSTRPLTSSQDSNHNRSRWSTERRTDRQTDTKTWPRASTRDNHDQLTARPSGQCLPWQLVDISYQFHHHWCQYDQKNSFRTRTFLVIHV